MNIQQLTDQLILHEGSKKVDGKHVPYRDSTGNLTVGYGHNLTANGISEEVARYILYLDMQNAINEARTLDWFEGLDDVRKNVVVDMVFNMGLPTFKTFKGTIDHIKRGEYKDASRHMLDSLWARQVKGRAVRLARMMETGEHYK